MSSISSRWVAALNRKGPSFLKETQWNSVWLRDQGRFCDRYKDVKLERWIRRRNILQRCRQNLGETRIIRWDVHTTSKSEGSEAWKRALYSVSQAVAAAATPAKQIAEEGPSLSAISVHSPGNSCHWPNTTRNHRERESETKWRTEGEQGRQSR